MFTFHCTLIALYFGRSCSHLPHELFVFWNPCTCPRECLKSASGLSSCHDLRCRRTVGVIWAFVLLTQPAHCLTSCHSPTPALLLPLALPLWRGRWSRRLQAPTGLHIKLKRVWLQPTPLYASCLWAVPPTSACIGAESERTGAGPGWWTNTLVTQLNGGMMHEIASSTELMGTSPSMAAWSIYIYPNTQSLAAQAPPQHNLFAVLPTTVSMNSKISSESFVGPTSMLALLNMVLHGYIHTFDADIKMFSSHPLYTNISGNIFCACFPQKTSLTLGLGCPAHLSRRWSPAPLAQPPCT